MESVQVLILNQCEIGDALIKINNAKIDALQDIDNVLKTKNFMQKVEVLKNVTKNSLVPIT